MTAWDLCYIQNCVIIKPCYKKVKVFYSKHTMCLLYDICVVLIFATYPFVFFGSDMRSISSCLFYLDFAGSACAITVVTLADRRLK